MGCSATKTTDDLREAGQPISVAPASDFLKSLPEIEKLKPPNSRIVVASEDGAVVFTGKRPPWTLGAALRATSLVPLILIWAALMLFIGFSDPFPMSLGAGIFLAIFTLIVLVARTWLFRSIPVQLMDVLGEWRLAARPDQILLRHSFMKLSASTAIEPKYVVLGNLASPPAKVTPPERTGADPFRNFILGLGDEDAKWLEQGLKLLYPQIDEIES